MQTRVIPSLLIHKGGLVKSVQFKDYKYVGDPINAVKIFNEKEVDEIAVIDIDASKENKAPNIEKISEIASEAFMPMAYGGGITTIEQIKETLMMTCEQIEETISLPPNELNYKKLSETFWAMELMLYITTLRLERSG